jgi:hypothetical protein
VTRFDLIQVYKTKMLMNRDSMCQQFGCSPKKNIQNWRGYIAGISLWKEKVINDYHKRSARSEVDVLGMYLQWFVHFHL